MQDLDKMQDAFIRHAIIAWRKGHKVSAAIINAAKELGMEINKEMWLSFEGLRVTQKSYGKVSVSEYLATWWPTVSNALFDGKSDAFVKDLWERTPINKRPSKTARIRNSLNSLKLYDRKSLQASGMATSEYKRGWLAKHDWKTVK